jgi:hypothetical protein
MDFACFWTRIMMVSFNFIYSKCNIKFASMNTKNPKTEIKHEMLYMYALMQLIEG